MFLLLLIVANSGLQLEQVAPVDWIGNPANLWSNTISPDGRIYFVNSLKGEVYVTNLKGDALPTIGKKGEGPGEFNWPHVVLFDQSFLYIYDSAKEVLYRVDPDSGTFLKHWRLPNAQALSLKGNHLAASFRIPRKRNIFGTATLGEKAITFQNFLGGIPSSLQVSGAKISTVLHATDGSLWMAYSGEFELLHYSRDGKLLQRIDQEPPFYVVPSQPEKISRFDTKSMSENVMKFDKMKSLYELEQTIVLYRPKVLSNSYLDVFDKQGKRLASYKSDNLYPIGVHKGKLYAFLTGSPEDEWDLMITRLHF